jgi:NitT/TauT family transport system substrate-binding protein
MRVVAQRGLWIVAFVMVGLVVAACAGPGASRAPAAAPAPGAAGPAAATGPAAGEPSAAPAPLAKVRAAFVVLGGPVLPVWIAADRGIYERYGLDVELTYIAGLAKIAETLIAGEIDIGASPAPTAIGAGLEGADLVMIACWSDKSAFSLMTHPSIQTVGDLQGKRLSVTRRGSASELWASAVLAPFGLAPERDYALLPMGGQPEQLAGLVNGAADGAVLGTSTLVQARKAGYRELLNYREHALEFSNVGAITSRRYLREQPAAAERFLQATAEGVAVTLRDTETALAVLSQRLNLDDREMLEETLAFERARTPMDMIPTPGGLRGAAQELAVNNPKAANVNPEDYADLTLIRKLNDSGFIQSLYR